MKVEKDYFVKYYNQTIKPEVLKFEKQHKEILKKYTKLKSNAGNKSSFDLIVKPLLRFNGVFVGLVFFIFFSNFLFSKAPGLIFIIMLFIFFVGLPIACASGIGSICFNIYCYGKKMAPFILSLQELRKLECTIKQTVMPVFCKMFKNLSWNYGTYNNRLQIFNSKVIPQNLSCKNNQGLDDIFFGKLDDTNFEIIELKAPIDINTKATDENNEQTYVSSVVLKISIDKKFDGHTLIYPSHCEKPFDLIETQLEDVIFEGKYNVYTNNEIEARYLITPKFMEALNNAKRILKCDEICCSFFNNNLFISLDYKLNGQYEALEHDLFSINIHKENLDDVYVYMKIFNELSNFYKVINYFKKA